MKNSIYTVVGKRDLKGQTKNLTTLCNKIEILYLALRKIPFFKFTNKVNMR